VLADMKLKDEGHGKASLDVITTNLNRYDIDMVCTKNNRRINK
jgi:hypothetical protein